MLSSPPKQELGASSWTEGIPSEKMLRLARTPPAPPSAAELTGPRRSPDLRRRKARVAGKWTPAVYGLARELPEFIGKKDFMVSAMDCVSSSCKINGEFPAAFPAASRCFWNGKSYRAEESEFCSNGIPATSPSWLPGITLASSLGFHGGSSASLSIAFLAFFMSQSTALLGRFLPAAAPLRIFGFSEAIHGVSMVKSLKILQIIIIVLEAGILSRRENLGGFLAPLAIQIHDNL
nr:hypothetical protein Iba_chr09cCG2120 [Ipomoea batatas]